VKQVPAIIESAIDITQIAAEVRKAHIALRDAEAAEQRAEAEHEKASENAARRRFELGQGLIKARKAWPARRGPKAKGWGEFCREQGFTTDQALDWMKYAGFVELSGTDLDDPESKAPTYADAGIDKRPRKSDSRDDDAAVWECVECGQENKPRASVCAECTRPRYHIEPSREQKDAVSRSLFDIEVAQRKPPAMEAREVAVKDLRDDWVSFFERRTKSPHRLTDATTSPNDFEQIKSTMIGVFNLIVEDLKSAGVIDDNGKERQRLLILDGGKK
jgi:hypothetical protein